MRKELQQVMGANVSSSYDKYLGLHTMVGRSKYNAFRGIKERVWIKLNNWKSQFLSSARKEILLNVVVQAVTTYHMSIFKLSKRLCKEISALMARFW